MLTVLLFPTVYFYCSLLVIKFSKNVTYYYICVVSY